MCVPWPGEYLLVGPRSWPGVTSVGNAMVVGGGGQAWRGGSARVLSSEAEVRVLDDDVSDRSSLSFPFLPFPFNS